MSDGAVANIANRVVMIGGHALEGRATGNWCTVSQVDRVSVDVGVDGEGMFKVNGNRSGTVTMVLTASSNSNDVLSSVMQAGLPFPLSILESPQGRSKFVASRAMLTKVADLVWSDGTEARSWTAVFTSGTLYTGGMPPGAVNEDIGVPA